MPFSPKDIHRVGEILAFAADTEIMPRFRRLTAMQVREKSSQFDLVTDADEKAEAVIECRLKAAFPDAIVIGEEGTHKNQGCWTQSPLLNWPSLSIRSTYEELHCQPAFIRRHGGGDCGRRDRGWRDLRPGVPGLGLRSAWSRRLDRARRWQPDHSVGGPISARL